MDPDILLVLGVIFGGLSIPSLVSAYSEGHPPRASLLMILLAAALLLAAIKTQPGGYTLDDVPQAFVRVFGQLLN